MIKIWLWRKLASGAVETGPAIQGIIKNIMWSLFTCYVVPDSLWPHGLQHIRFLCIPLPPGVCSNICPLSRWWYLTISSSAAPISFWFQAFPGSQSFPMAFHIRWPKYWSISISLSNEYSGLLSFQFEWLDLLAVQEILKSLLQHDISKASVLWHSAFFTLQLSHPYMTTGKP